MVVIVIVLAVIVLSSGQNGGVPGSQSNSSTTASTQASSSTKTFGQTYYNKSLGFSFTNPRSGSWIMTANNTDGSLVSFGPRVSQVGVGVKVYYWPGSTEFPLFTGGIKTITDLRNAVSAKYTQVIPYYIKTIYTGGFSMIEVQGLTTSFGTTNIYFVLLPNGTLNFGGTGSLSGFIQKI